MSKTAKIRGFVRFYDLNQVFEIVQLPESMAVNFLTLIERKEPGLNARSVATMTAMMLSLHQDNLKVWIANHGERPLNLESGETIKEVVLRHMNTGVFTEKEAMEMAFQKAAWFRLMKFYEDYREWKESRNIPEKIG